VATKYLNRYMALFLFMRRLKDMDSRKKTETLIGTIKWFHCHISRESLKEQHLFSVNAALRTYLWVKITCMNLKCPLYKRIFDTSFLCSAMVYGYLNM